jgi:hypothetical protein
MSASDAIQISTLVATDPGTAFELFTRDVDLWWRRGPRHRPSQSGDGTMRFEAGVGGRLVEVYDESASDAYEIGRILVWEPGARLVLDWRPRSFAPGERTEVEVRFEAEGDSTRVTVTHRGWDSIASDHPSRHGWTGEAFTQLIGLGWAERLVSFQAGVAWRRGTAA